MIGTVAAVVSRMDVSSMELILGWRPLRKNQQNTNEPHSHGRRAAKKRNPVQYENIVGDTQSALRARKSSSRRDSI